MGDDKLTEKCEKRLQESLSKNSRIHFLIDSIEKLGCSIPRNFFSCRECEGDISGGFTMEGTGIASNIPSKPGAIASSYIPQILICQNKNLPDETFDNTIIHELVHAYDKCRSKLTLSSCEQHACSEIRASNISGECDAWPEAKRGHFKYAQGQSECVKRRAALSVSMNPACQNRAGTCVDAVFSKCYGDISPYADEEAL